MTVRSPPVLTRPARVRSIQPVLDTRQKQLLAWQRLLLDWHRSRNRYSLEVNEWELFDNPAINSAPQRARNPIPRASSSRKCVAGKLDRKGRETVLDFLVQNGARVHALG